MKLYINKRKPRNVVSNITHKQEKIFEAHTESNPGYEEYVPAKQYNELLKRIKEKKHE